MALTNLKRAFFLTVLVSEITEGSGAYWDPHLLRVDAKHFHTAHVNSLSAKIILRSIFSARSMDLLLPGSGVHLQSLFRQC